MLEAVNLECVRGERSLFAGVAFRLSGGEALHVQGGNGVGKTSLLRMLCGLTPPAAGEVRWRGKAISHLGDDFRSALCYLGHDNASKADLTPLENLLSAARIADQALDADAAHHALAQIGLRGYEDLPCRYLSQGQKRRVALARLVHERRALWILDEPYVALDTQAIELVAGLIGAHLQRGGLLVLTTHQPLAIHGTEHTLRTLSLDAR